MTLNKYLIDKLDIMTKRSLKLRSKISETDIPKAKKKKTIKLWIKSLQLIKAESKKIK